MDLVSDRETEESGSDKSQTKSELTDDSSAVEKVALHSDDEEESSEEEKIEIILDADI